MSEEISCNEFEILPFNVSGEAKLSAKKERKGSDILLKVIIHRPGQEDASFLMSPDWHEVELSRRNWRAREYLKELSKYIELTSDDEKRTAGEALIKISELGKTLKEIPAAEEKPKEIEISEADKAEALKLLKDPKLLFRIKTALDTNIAGEDESKLTIYLSGVSRKVKGGDLSLLVAGDSAAGKSFITSNTLTFLPPESVLSINRASSTAFDYAEDIDFSKIILFVAEGAGAAAAAEAIKTMTDGSGSSASLVSEKTAWGSIQAKLKHRKGDPIFMTTSAKIINDFEFTNRLLSVSVDLSEEQTKRVLKKQAEKEATPWDHKDDENNQKIFHNAFRLIPYDVLVCIPFASQIESLFNTGAVRTRRDRLKMTALIKASAALHYYQREKIEKEGKEYVIATIQDFFNAFAIAHNSLQQTAEGLDAATKKLLDFLIKEKDDIFEPVKDNKNDIEEPIADGYKILKFIMRHKLVYSRSRLFSLLGKLTEEGYIGSSRLERKKVFWINSVHCQMSANFQELLTNFLSGKIGDSAPFLANFLTSYDCVRGGDTPEIILTLSNPLTGEVYTPLTYLQEDRKFEVSAAEDNEKDDGKFAGRGKKFEEDKEKSGKIEEIVRGYIPKGKKTGLQSLKKALYNEGHCQSMDEAEQRLIEIEGQGIIQVSDDGHGGHVVEVIA
jgi:hypothetical protein